MSKKHFEALAARLHACKPGGENKYASTKAKHVAQGRMEQWRDMVRAVASVCGTFNGSFDRQRFLTACGMED